MAELNPPSALRVPGLGPPGLGPEAGRNARPEPGFSRFNKRFGKPRPTWYVPVVSVASTVLVVGVLAYLVWQSNSRDLVVRQFFNWEKFWDAFPDILDGFWLDMRMFIVAEVAILAMALLLAVMRSLRGPEFFPLRLFSIVFIDIFRGVPLLLLILLLGFGVPTLRISWVPSDPLFWGVTALVLSYSAYTAEVYRSGIESVSESQHSSARSMGLTQWQGMRHVILPQAVRNVVPALLNGLVSLQKDVALVSVVGVREALREAEIYAGKTFNYTSYMVATVLFLLVSIPFARFADWYAKRDRQRRTQSRV